MAEDIKKFVIDTSVIIKWLTSEKEDRAKADAILGDFLTGKINILVPALISWEVNNYLGRIYGVEEATTLYSHFQLYGLTQAILMPSTCLFAFTFMKKCPGVSFYDASYHSLAIQNKATFITCDKKYYQKAHKLGHIKLLKDY